MAGADAALHHGGGLARPPSRSSSRCISSSFRKSRPSWKDEALGRKVDARSGRSAASSPARWRSSGRRRRSARRWRRCRSSTSTDAELLAALARRRHGRDRHHQRDRRDGTDQLRPAPSRSPTSAGRGGRRREGGGPGLTKCARSWRYTADVGDDREFPDVSARDAAVLHELRRSDASIALKTCKMPRCGSLAACRCP